MTLCAPVQRPGVSPCRNRRLKGGRHGIQRLKICPTLCCNFSLWQSLVVVPCVMTTSLCTRERHEGP